MTDPTTESLSRAAPRGLHCDEMAPTPFKRNASFADLHALPEDHVGELIDGALWTAPRPATGHAIACGELSRRLGPVIDDAGPSGWVILMDVEVRLGPDLVVPDLVGWRRARLPVVPDTTVLELVPDWVCEVMSPSTAWLDRGRKRFLYERAGVAHLWYVDPVHQLVEVLALEGGAYRMGTVAGRDERVRLPPFDGIELALATLWRR